MREIHSLWIGERLGPVEELCLASFVARGHRFFLHTYRDMWVPDGVTLLDANRLLPESEIFGCRSVNNSVAVFADCFRVKILKHHPAMWVDTDIFCLNPFDFRADYVLEVSTRRRALYVNNCIMAFPPQSELMAIMEGLVDHPEQALKYLPWEMALRERAVGLVKGGVQKDRLPWGWAGFRPLSVEVMRLNLLAQADLPRSFGLGGEKLFSGAFDFARSLAMGADHAHFLSSRFLTANPDLARPAAGSFFEHCVKDVGHLTRAFG
jgi:hypothetical protein